MMISNFSLILKTIWSLSVVALAGFPLKSAAQNTPITVYYTIRAPLIIKMNDDIGGIVGSPSVEAFRRANLPANFVELSLARQLIALEENTKPVCALNYFKRAEREKIGNFTAPVAYDSPLGVLTLATNQAVREHPKFESLVAAPELRFARKVETSFGPYLDALVSTHKPRLIESLEENNARVAQLQAGRADYMFIQKPEAEYLIENSGFDQNNFVHIQMLDAPPINTRHIICSKNISSDQILALNAAIMTITPPR
jgi:polar amino acid transport system substrate-binding protein